MADAARLAAGHPAVLVANEGAATVYQTRLSTTFGKGWLGFCLVLTFFLLFGGRNQSIPFREVVGLLTVGIPFVLIGLAFTVSTYRVCLMDDQVVARWRIVGPLGWTWRLDAGDKVDVSLAFRGARSNGNPELAIVVASEGKDIDFGAFLPMDRKQYLAAAIRDYYRG